VCVSTLEFAFMNECKMFTHRELMQLIMWSKLCSKVMASLNFFSCSRNLLQVELVEMPHSISTLAPCTCMIEKVA